MVDFPEVIDSTIVGAFRSCPQKAFRGYFEHWKPRTPSVHLHAGHSYARGLEVARRSYFQDGKPSDEAIALGLQALILAYGDFEPPEGSAKTLERTAGAFEFHFDRYPLETEKATPVLLPSGKRAVEFSFADPIEVLHPVTGNPIIYCGRTDQLVDFAEGVFLEDDKTATQLGASWSRQWDLRSQFTGYCWGAGNAGIRVNGILVRGVSILKTKYDTLQAITYRSPWEIARWYQQLLRDVRRMIDCWASNYFDYNLDHACTEYGGCEFLQICKSNDPEAWLPMNFQRRAWDPLTRTETLLEAA